MNEKLNRRDFLKLAGLTGASLILASCRPATPSPTEQAQPSATPKPTEPQPTPKPVEPTQAPPPAEPVKLIQWDWWVTQGPWFDEEIQLFQEANPGITVERVMQREMDQALPLAFAEGKLPDFYMGGPPLTEQYNTGQWLAYDLSSFVDFPEFKNSFPNPEIDFVEGKNVFDGKCYTAPREARNAWWNQVFINLDLFDKYGITRLPDTDEEFLDAARKVTKDSGGVAYGYANGFATGWMNMLIEWQGARSFAVGGLDWRTHEYVYSKNPHYAGILEMLATLREEGLILPEASSIDDEGMRAMFADGKVAMINGGMWNVNGWKQTHPDFSHYTIIPPLILGDKQEYTYYTGPGQTGEPFYLGSTTRHPNEAWAWYKWLHTLESGIRWVKSGNGLSIFPEANDPKYITDQVWKDYVVWMPKLNRVGPSPEVRNPNTGKLNVAGPEPNFAAITGGVYAGEISVSQLPEVLAELDRQLTENFAIALEDAQKAGVDVKFEDFVFPDWDPLQDYITKPGA